MLVVSPAICGTVLARFGSEAQRARWLHGLADGTLKMAFAITEPGAGSNSHQIATSAVREGEGYRLRGSKYYISGVDEAGAVLVVARTSLDERTGRADLSLFVVDTDARGLECTPIAVEAVVP